MKLTIRIFTILLKQSVIFLILASLLWIAYLRITYIDHEITDGEGYGFRIGMSKKEVYEAIPKYLTSLGKAPEIYFIKYELSEDLAQIVGDLAGSELLIQSRFLPNGFATLSNTDDWRIYFEIGYMDSISFKFCSELLCKIVRHRQEFEIP